MDHALTVFESLGLQSMLVVALVFFAGGLVKGAMGFGLPLTTMAILPTFLPVDFALAVNAMTVPFLNVGQFVHARRMRETLRRFGPVVGGIALGVPAGATMVSLVSERWLLMALGLFVLVFVAMTVAQPAMAIDPRSERRIGAGVGLVGGVIGALTTANGPIFVMYLVGLKVDRKLFLSTLSLLFIVSGVLISASFLVAGLLTPERAAGAAIALPAAVAGMLAGNMVGERISARRFRALVLAALVALGLNLVAQAFG